VSALILTNAKETCRYVAADEKFLLGGATSGSNTISTALALSAKTVSIDQFPVEVTVRYIDQLFSTRFETLHALYNTSDNSLTRATMISSTTGAPISFDEELVNDNLVIYGTTSHAVNGVQILKDYGLGFDGTDKSTSSLTAVEFYTFTAVPTVPSGSILRLHCSLSSRVTGDSSVNDVRGRFNTKYKDSGGIWVRCDGATSSLLGFTNLAPASSTTTAYQDTNMITDLSDLNKNADGDWEIQITARADFVNNTVESYSLTYHMQELFING